MSNDLRILGFIETLYVSTMLLNESYQRTISVLAPLLSDKNKEILSSYVEVKGATPSCSEDRIVEVKLKEIIEIVERLTNSHNDLRMILCLTDEGKHPETNGKREGR